MQTERQPRSAGAGRQGRGAMIGGSCALRRVSRLRAVARGQSRRRPGSRLSRRHGVLPEGSRRATRRGSRAEQAAERAKALMPKEFCGPDWLGRWLRLRSRIRARLVARLRAAMEARSTGRKQYEPREHSFVVLDPVGNCLANIPGNVTTRRHESVAHARPCLPRSSCCCSRQRDARDASGSRAAQGLRRRREERARRRSGSRWSRKARARRR